MAIAIYKLNRRFDYTDADLLQSYLWKQGFNVSVDSGYPSDELRITGDVPVDVLNKAVEMATMHYCEECTRRLESLREHML